MLVWAATAAGIVSTIPQSGPAGNRLWSTTAAAEHWLDGDIGDLCA
jgi:hypothetical protein